MRLEALQEVRLAQVQGDGDGLDPVGGAKLTGQLLQQCTAPGQQQQVEAALGQVLRVGATDARRRAGDEGPRAEGLHEVHGGSLRAPMDGAKAPGTRFPPAARGNGTVPATVAYR